MKNWADMNAADFYRDGTQLDILAGIRGDGYGTLDLLDAAAQAVTVPVEMPVIPATDGGLFAVTVDMFAAATEGMLF